MVQKRFPLMLFTCRTGLNLEHLDPLQLCSPLLSMARKPGQWWQQECSRHDVYWKTLYLGREETEIFFYL